MGARRGAAGRGPTAEAVAGTHNRDWNGTVVEITGILGLLILIADVWAIINVFSSAASTGAKVLWIVVILLLPVLGLILWLLFGPRKAAVGV